MTWRVNGELEDTPFISGRADRRYSPPARACKPNG